MCFSYFCNEMLRRTWFCEPHSPRRLCGWRSRGRSCRTTSESSSPAYPSSQGWRPVWDQAGLKKEIHFTKADKICKTSILIKKKTFKFNIRTQKLSRLEQQKNNENRWLYLLTLDFVESLPSLQTAFVRTKADLKKKKVVLIVNLKHYRFRVDSLTNRRN